MKFKSVVSMLFRYYQLRDELKRGHAVGYERYMRCPWEEAYAPIRGRGYGNGREDMCLEFIDLERCVGDLGQEDHIILMGLALLEQRPESISDELCIVQGQGRSREWILRRYGRLKAGIRARMQARGLLDDGQAITEDCKVSG